MTETQHPMFAPKGNSAPYAGLSAPGGSTASREANAEDIRSGKISDMHRIAIEHLRVAGPFGLTWAELGEKEGWHHGRVTSVLSNLHRDGTATRLAGKQPGRGEGRSSVYVLPEFVEGRKTAVYRGSKASAAIKAEPEHLARIAGLEKELALFKNKVDDSVALRAELDQTKAELQAAVARSDQASDALREEKFNHERTVGELRKADEVNVQLAVEMENLRRIRDAMGREYYEVDQILGKALGFPEAYPDVSDVNDGSVVTGEHIVVSLAGAAAEKITETARENAALRELNVTLKDIADNARPSVPTLNAEEAQFLDRAEKMVQGRIDTAQMPVRAGSVRTLVSLAKRLPRA
jgi:hypothetical protein